MAENFRTQKFHLQLMLLFVSFTVLTVGLVTTLMSLKTTDILREHAWDYQHRVVRQTVNNINQKIQTIENLYLFFSSNRSVFTGLQHLEETSDYQVSYDIRRMKELMFSFVIQIEGLETVIIVSSEGTTISNLGGRFAPKFFQKGDLKGQEIFLWLEEDPTRTIWYQDEREGSAEVYYLRSLFDPDSLEYLGILAFVIKQDIFLNLIAEMTQPGGGVSIADETGRPIIFPDREPDNLPERLPGAAIQEREPVTVETAESLKIIYPVDNGWFVTSEISKRELYNFINVVVMVGVVVSLIAIGLGIVSAVILARGYTHDLSHLVDAMNVSSSGTLKSLSYSGRTFEFRQLAFTYNEMVENLAKLTGELKTEIDEKTKAEVALKDFNETLEYKIADRTLRLRESLETLQMTQSHLIEAEKMASLGSLVAGLAHELNTPIGVSITGASFLSDRIADLSSAKTALEDLNADELQDFLEVAHQLSESILLNQRRLSDLVSDFKQVSVDRSHDFKRAFCVSEYFSAVVGSLKISLENLNVDIDCPADIVITSFPGVYGQILTNLVQNASIHAYPEGSDGPLLITVALDGTNLTVEVVDEGVGMDSKTRNKVFEPFFTTRRNKGGTGLGLHIVYNLVTQKLGGRIDCRSILGQGSQFIMIMPLDDDEKSVPELSTSE